MKLNVLVFGLGKSGTSICHAKIRKGLPMASAPFEPESYGEALNRVDIHRALCDNQNGAVVKSILNPEIGNRISEIIPLYDKVVLIYRDPRDWVLSKFFYQWHWGHHPNKDDFLDAFTRILDKEMYPNDTPFHSIFPDLTDVDYLTESYNALLTSVNEIEDSIYAFRYEDLINGNVDGLNNYLGFNIDTSADVANSVSRVKRTMRSGDWRIWFTDEDVHHYRGLLNPILDKLKYDSSDWELKYPDKISPKTGSEYMKKLFTNHSI